MADVQREFDNFAPSEFVSRKDLIVAAGQLLSEKTKKLASFNGLSSLGLMTAGVALTAFGVWAGKKVSSQIPNGDIIGNIKFAWELAAPHMGKVSEIANTRLHEAYALATVPFLKATGLLATTMGAGFVGTTLKQK